MSMKQNSWRWGERGKMLSWLEQGALGKPRLTVDSGVQKRGSQFVYNYLFASSL